MPESKRDVGIYGEETAVTFLKKEGYKLIERNYRSPFGEVDIIAEEDGFLVFVEVKFRKTSSFGSPLDAITRDKKRHIIRSALYYLKTTGQTTRRVRFDVLGISNAEPKLVKNAFLIEE